MVAISANKNKFNNTDVFFFFFRNLDLNNYGSETLQLCLKCIVNICASCLVSRLLSLISLVPYVALSIQCELRLTCLTFPVRPVIANCWHYHHHSEFLPWTLGHLAVLKTKQSVASLVDTP